MKSASILLLGVFFLAGESAAADQVRSWPGAKVLDGWRIVAGDKTEVTSDCLGDMTSPLCVVDTMMACDAWSPDRDLLPAEDVLGWRWDSRPAICDPLRSEPGNKGTVPRTFNFHTANPKYYRVRYQVATFTVTAAMMEGARVFWRAPDAPPNEFETRPGDLAAIIRWRWCAPPATASYRRWRSRDCGCFVTIVLSRIA